MAHSKEFIQAIWEKGRIARGSDPKIWRKDTCNAWIKRNEYGNRSSQFGWEIDRITTGIKGGSYTISNCRPLQWRNNVKKSGGNLVCVVHAKRGSYRRENETIK